MQVTCCLYVKGETKRKPRCAAEMPIANEKMDRASAIQY